MVSMCNKDKEVDQMYMRNNIANVTQKSKNQENKELGKQEGRRKVNVHVTQEQQHTTCYKTFFDYMFITFSFKVF